MDWGCTAAAFIANDQMHMIHDYRPEEILSFIRKHSHGLQTPVWIQTPEHYFDENWEEHDSKTYFRDRLSACIELIFPDYSPTFYFRVNPDTKQVKVTSY